ncbi:MAG: ACP S-malonyltransferase, partial [Chloroflexi bacterium]|nr:ACP S-malonyltransferase [Chloroflexota bacterium]
VRERGRLMQAAGNGNGRPSGMAAVMGVDDEELNNICAAVRAGHPWSGLQVANFNSPGQTVISGSTDAVQAAAELARQRGAKRVIPLPVSAAFHSLLMEPVAEELAKELAQVEVGVPSVPLVANVTGRPMSDPGEIRRELILQTYSPVRWVDSVRFMVGAGVGSFVEVGPGKVLSGLIKRIDRQTQAYPAEELLGVGELV